MVVLIETRKGEAWMYCGCPHRMHGYATIRRMCAYYNHRGKRRKCIQEGDE